MVGRKINPGGFPIAGIQGQQGPQGPQGASGTPGRGIMAITRTGGTGAPGTTDTYTITYTDFTTSTFQLYNGANGGVLTVNGRSGTVTGLAEATDLTAGTVAAVFANVTGLGMAHNFGAVTNLYSTIQVICNSGGVGAGAAFNVMNGGAGVGSFGNKSLRFGGAYSGIMALTAFYGLEISVGGTSTSRLSISAAGGVSIPGNLTVGSINRGPLAGFRNRIINGGFDVWQRGTSGFSIGAYSADRWNTDSGTSVSRSTDAPTGFAYSLKHTAVAGNAVHRQAIELPAVGSQGEYYDGATFIFSCWCKTSVAGKTLALYVAFGTSVANNSIRTVANNLPIGTTTAAWAKYSYTITIPAGASIAAANCIEIVPYVISPNCDVYMTGIQFEPGTVATPFEFRPIATELALCQRYYYRIIGDQQVFGVGYSHVTNSTARVLTQFPVTMRVAPTAVEQVGSAGHYAVLFAGAANTCIAVPTFVAATPNIGTTAFTATGHTAGQAGVCYSQSALGYLGWSAEL